MLLLMVLIPSVLEKASEQSREEEDPNQKGNSAGEDQVYLVKKAQLGVPHLEMQVEINGQLNLKAGTCPILNFA